MDQGCPLSVIEFLFYNVNLLDIARPQEGSLTLGFIDDVALVARGKSFEEVNEKLKDLMERLGGALEWSEQQNAEFKIEQTALICASCTWVPDPSRRGHKMLAPRVPITIRGHRIEPLSSHKFLGVIIDQELCFQEHAAYALAKGTKYVQACGRMTRPVKGIRGKMMKKLYKGVVIPKMLYAADVWCARLIRRRRGQKNKGKGARGFATKMARVQWMATILITGGMRTTATDILEAHANLLPFQQTLRKHCFRTALRMSTLSAAHPLHKELISVKRNRKRHRAPLHELLNEFNLNPHHLETINATRHNPKWTPDTMIEIADSKEEAAIADTDADEEVRIYTDRSAIDGGVGGAAVLVREG